ncbi:MAG: VWA domain-containing protein [Myxococcales bacterium]|nr:VWA domain-containing protein [Myxococcales bacterium]
MRKIAMTGLALAWAAVHCGGTSLMDGSPTAGCTKDTDCKGTRVCRASQCVDETGDAGGLPPSGDAAGIGPDAVSIGTDGAPPDPLASCGTLAFDVAVKREPVVMEIVLDGSGSMDSDNKWTAAVAGLTAFFDEVLAAAAPDLAVGLIVYEDQNDPTNGIGPYPSVKDLYPAVVTAQVHQALTKRLTDSAASGGTPTFLALSGAHALLKNYVPAGALAGARKAAVLISDGVPNGGAAEQAQCVTAAKDALALTAPAGPILTFSAGVGPFPGTAFSYDPGFMGDLAVAGGTRASPQCNPRATNVADVCHMQITPLGATAAVLKLEFSKAVRRARSSVVGCEQVITGTGYDPARSKVSVKDTAGQVTELPRGGADGWEFDDDTAPTKVIFNGTSCATAVDAAELLLRACPE